MNSNADIRVELLSVIERYVQFASTVKPFASPSATAQYMLLVRSCNSFSAAVSLCMSGFFVESYNSARVGLETGWLSLVLRRSATKSWEWLTLVPSDTSMEVAEKRYKDTFGSPAWIRKEVSQDGKELRDNLYQVLSTKSHANVAATFFMCSSANDPNDLCLYGPGPLDSEEHRSKHLRGILYSLCSLLHDIQVQCGVDLGVTWRHDEMGLFNIAGVGYPDKDSGVRVVPKKVNAAYQTMVLLKLAKCQQSGATAMDNLAVERTCATSRAGCSLSG
ncbi:hypothetical protein [Rhodoferax sp.]|uniref:hypothetical protein n=1 Tax=Rhodoferax sp. TaxID=50421 RepID=UPI002636984C|nr:hypothetical protein [Rhodoferax sp.]MDD2917621.1 hypothetical protein [Rhodoferax sp.]